MKFVPEKVTRTICRNVLTIKKNSPHLFFVGGLVGVVGSTVLACRATLKLEEKLDKIKKDLEEAKKTPVVEDEVSNFSRVCVKSGVELGKLYGPSIAVGAVSVAALTGSHIQLTRRNAALTFTLAMVSKAYDDYRLRVQEEIGKERELDIYRDIKTEIIDIDGKKKTVKTVDSTGYSPYARFFDETARGFVKNAEMNRVFLSCQQTYANHLLRSRGHVFLNEIYDALGMERSRAGQVVGWVIDGDGDGYVDFGLYEPHSNRFMNGFEPCIILDFNVDGVIYHLLDENNPTFITHKEPW